MHGNDAQGIQQKGGQVQDSKETRRTPRQYRKGSPHLSEKARARNVFENERAKAWRKANPEAARERDKRYRARVPGGYAAKQKDWRAKHHEHSKAYHREYMSRNRREDINYKLRRLLASRLGTALRRTGNHKNIATEALLGCTIAFFKDYIAARFKKGMTWANHAKTVWHLDHRIPCSAFDLSITLICNLCGRQRITKRSPSFPRRINPN